MKKLQLSLAIILFTAMGLFAQEKKDFKASGSAFAKLFTNFHIGLGTANDNQGFELQRAYLGYKYNFAEGFTGKVTFDIGNPNSNSKLERTAYVKNASITYKKDALSIKFGLISTIAFKEQEKVWGYRYFYKSFQDENKYNPSADMGFATSYQLLEGLSIDASITNGEGYKTLQSDNRYRYGAGLTYKDSGLILRAYADIKNKDDETLENQSILALFAAYQTKIFSIGAEYNMLTNHKYVKDNNISGISLYSTYKASKTVKFFARYDKMQSENDWNTSNDGSTLIAGMEYSPVKNLKIAPNYQLFTNDADDSNNQSYAYLSLQIAF
jgi:hypothetical protein